MNNFESFIIKGIESPKYVIKFYERENFDTERFVSHRDMIIDLMKQDSQKYGETKSAANVVKYLRENLDILQLVPEMARIECIGFSYKYYQKISFYIHSVF